MPSSGSRSVWGGTSAWILTGFFSYEDIWLPGQFRATNPPRDPVPAATAAGREIFPDIARLDELVKKLPAEVAVVVVVPPTLSHEGGATRHGRGGGKGGMQLSA